MRKSLNNNPLIAILVIGVLGVGVALFLMSSMSSSSSSSTDTTATTTDTTATTTDPTAAPTTASAPTGTAVPTTGTAAPTTSVPDASATAPAPTGETVDPTTGLPVPAPAATTPPPVGSFAAGPGLPKSVVSAHKQGDAVALLIVKRNGIDDRAVRGGFRKVVAMPQVAAFETLAKHVARYARITQGVDLDRVPALVVIRPKSRSGSGPPQATVTYGFNDPAQLVQAARDALYHGPENLPYHPS